MSTGDVLDLLARELHAQPVSRQVLDRAVLLARRFVPGAAASITLLDRRRRLTTVAVSGDVAGAGDALQYDRGEGPCIDAARDQDVVHSRDLLTDGRWSGWGAQVAGRLGVRSILSLRLATAEVGLGSLNVYGREPDAFDDETVALAGGLAAHATVAYTRTLDRENLESALANRTVIGQAQGILMERHKVTAARAFELLATVSQDGNVKLAEVARRLVETGVDPQPRRR
ncbi:GAF and ANTAR domain-containing protein [Geodermatophilus pulveris]|uniref:GAF and ANTAR domain-containing protein n=1 Tax=Geodermatophilus pulveris TaxID=1564159 RepID=UPI0015C5B178|nr:GAF and ANTAR domain-containing protein [Geodermatophilus pulveris]